MRLDKSSKMVDVFILDRKDRGRGGRGARTLTARHTRAYSSHAAAVYISYYNIFGCGPVHARPDWQIVRGVKRDQWRLLMWSLPNGAVKRAAAGTMKGPTLTPSTEEKKKKKIHTKKNNKKKTRFEN